MNIPFFHRKPAHTQVRYIVPTRRELSEAEKRLRQRRADIRMELEIMALHVEPARRDSILSRAVTTPLTDKQREQGRGGGGMAGVRHARADAAYRWLDAA